MTHCAALNEKSVSDKKAESYSHLMSHWNDGTKNILISAEQNRLAAVEHDVNLVSDFRPQPVVSMIWR